MKRWIAAGLLAGMLMPGVAFAGAATDAALGLGAFAVFNQILGGIGIFGGPHPRPVVVAPPPPPPVVYHVAPPPPVVYRVPAPRPVVVYPAPPVVVRRGYVYGAPPAYGAFPVYAAPPVYGAPRGYAAPPPYWCAPGQAKKGRCGYGYHPRSRHWDD